MSPTPRDSASYNSLLCIGQCNNVTELSVIHGARAQTDRNTTTHTGKQNFKNTPQIYD